MKPGDLVRYKEKYLHFPGGIGIFLDATKKLGYPMVRILWEDGRISETYEETVEVISEGG